MHADTDAPLLQVRHLQVGTRTRTLLGPLALQVRAGRTALLGPNGSGKSTLLKALAGLPLPGLHCQGERLLGKRALETLPDAERARQLSWLGQGSQGDTEGLDTSGLSVTGLVSMAGMARGGWSAWLRHPALQDVAAALERFELQACAHACLTAISGGEWQRAHLARVFAAGAPILLLDEPGNHLDLRHRMLLAQAMAQRAAAGHAVVFSTHDFEMAMQAERLVLLRQGRIVLDAASADLSDAVLAQALGEVFDCPIRVVRDSQGGGNPQGASTEPMPRRIMAERLSR